MSGFQVMERAPTVQEYQALRATTDWAQIDDDIVVRALKGSAFFLVAEHDARGTIGMARVICDDIYFFIVDVIVHPNFQGQGIGTAMMDKVMQFLETNKEKGTFFGLMAASGKKSFYEQFGFRVRHEDAPGMYIQN